MWTPQFRLLLAFFGLAVGFTAVSWRLCVLQVEKHDFYVQRAARAHEQRVVIPAKRGEIYDRNGELLAGNLPLGRVVADAKNMRDRALVADVVAPHLKMDRDALLERLESGRIYIELAKDVDQTTLLALGRDLKAHHIRTVRIESDWKRIYPNGMTLSHVIGFLSYDRVGAHGVERSMEDHLHGVDGERSVLRHARGQEEIVAYRGEEIPPRDGARVTLTIDMGIQDIVEQLVNETVNRYSPQTVTAIVSRPATGEILAMVRRPTFDPDQPSKSDSSHILNGAVAGVFEPGSTFKIVVTAAVLNEEMATLESVIDCENGQFAFGGGVLRDHRPFGNLTVKEILARSSNIGSAKLGIQLGERRFYNYMRRFGFGFRTGIELPGEVRGLVPDVDKWSPITISRVPMGQGVAVSPIQLITALNVIANHGRLVLPRLILRIEASDGTILHEHQPVVERQVISEKAALATTAAMEDVVGPHGTGSLAAIPPFRVAGKSGTAQKKDPNGPNYLPDGQNILSFMGFFPAEAPEISLLVIVDEPIANREENAGGRLAGALFAAVGSAIASYLNLQPGQRQEALAKARVTGQVAKVIAR